MLTLRAANAVAGAVLHAVVWLLLAAVGLLAFLVTLAVALAIGVVFLMAHTTHPAILYAFRDARQWEGRRQ